MKEAAGFQAMKNTQTVRCSSLATAFLLLIALSLLVCLPEYGRSENQDRQDTGLSQKWREWLDEEVVYIISDRERDLFKQLTTDEQRESFEEQFWLQRDPTPGTDRNEFKEEHERRLKYANNFFGRDTVRPGWKTDRGKMYIILGKPKDISQFMGHPDIYPCELWSYQGDIAKGLPSFFYLIFFRHRGSGELILYQHAIHTPQNLFIHPDSSRDPYQSLRNVNMELAHAAYTYLPDESPPIYENQVSLASSVLIAKVANVKNVDVDATYAEQILLGKEIVTTVYAFSDTAVADFATPYIDTDGICYIDYAFELSPEQMEMGLYEDHYYGALDIEVFLADVGGVTVLSKKRPIEINLDQQEFARASSKPFLFMDRLACLPGEYLLTVRINNKVSKKYSMINRRVSVPVMKTGSVGTGPLLLARGKIDSPGRRLYLPFAFDTASFLPSPRLVFNEKYPPILYSQIFLPPRLLGEVPERIVARTSLAKTAGEELGSGETSVAGGHFSEFGTIAYVADLPVAGLEPGNYRINLAVDFGSAGVVQRSAEFVLTDASLSAPFLLFRDDIPVSAAGVLYEFGSALRDQGAKDQARILYAKALSADPGNKNLRCDISDLLVESGDCASSIAVLETVLVEEPNDQQVLRLMARSYLGLGEYGKAAKFLERLLVQEGDTTETLNLLAEAYWKDGEADKASGLWRRSLRLDPSQSLIEEKLKRAEDHP
jgi:GWxTD domain-containing protein